MKGKNSLRAQKGLIQRLVLTPYSVWALLFIIVPLVFVAYYAFTDNNYQFTTRNILRFFTETSTVQRGEETRETYRYLLIFGRSLKLAVISTLICLLLGYLQSGLTGNHETIFTKSMLDFVSAIILASTLGLGVCLSGAFVLVYQGAIVLLARWAAPILSDYVVAEMSCAGSLLIVALGLNMLGITKLKVANLLPAMFLPIVFCLFMK